MPNRTTDPSINKTIKSPRGPNLHARYWEVDDPKGLICLTHGFSEHLGCYHHLAEALNKSRFTVFGHDHIGHGKSEGVRVYADSVDEYVEDIVHHCELMTNENPNLPLFLLGHSMGGMISLRACLNYPNLFKGLVLMGPLIIPGPSFGPIDFRVTSLNAPFPKLFLGALDKINPQMALGFIDYKVVSRDPEMWEMMAKDDLRWHGGCKVHLLLAFVRCLEDNFNLMSGLKVPFLALHGENDRLCNPLGSKLLVEKAFTEDKTLVTYPGGMHHLYIDSMETRENAINTTVKWFDSRC